MPPNAPASVACSGRARAAAPLAVFLLLTAGEALAGQGPSAPSAPSALSGGFYIHPLWLAAVVLVTGGWIWASCWISDDALATGLAHRQWSLGLVGAGLVGFVLSLTIHPLLLLAMAAGVGGPLAFYIRLRNAVVPEEFQVLPAVLGAAERSREEQEGPMEEEALLEMNAEVEFVNPAGHNLSDVVQQKSEWASAARVLRNLVARAGQVEAGAVRIERAPESCRLLFRTGDVMSTIGELEPGLGQQLMALTARYARLRKKNKAELRATLPDEREIALQVRSQKVNARPALLLELPDWHSEIYRSGLAELGMESEMARELGELVSRPGTSIIISGPLRSGKTSTFHALVADIDIFVTDVTNLESRLSHELNQVHRTEVDLDSVEAVQEVLPGLLRQEPDVLTADELTNPQVWAPFFEFAAEEGRFIGTINALSAPAAVVKLLRGVEGEVLARSLACVLNQRLVRRLCPECKERVKPNPGLLKKLKIDPQDAGTWFRPGACPNCAGIGYRGQVAVFEKLTTGEALGELLAEGGADPVSVRRAAGRKHHHTMLQDALEKVKSGLTTLEEVRRVLNK